MSQLVPVLKMMFGVTRHSLTFDIWGQTQLCKDKRGDKLKPTSAQDTAKSQSYLEVYCASTLFGPDFQSRPFRDAERCRDQSCLEGDPTANLSPPAVMEPAAMLVIMLKDSQVMWPLKRISRKKLWSYLWEMQWQFQSAVLGPLEGRKQVFAMSNLKIIN